MKKLTPVLLVESIEPCLPFWVERLGFERTLEIPHGDALGFVILVHGEVEVMLQSRASAKADFPPLAGGPFASDGVGLYVEVEDFAKIRDAVRGCEVIVPERTTFYGSREIGVRAPGGFTVLFSARA